MAAFPGSSMSSETQRPHGPSGFELSRILGMNRKRTPFVVDRGDDIMVRHFQAVRETARSAKQIYNSHF
jgi:hypothetical protein